MISLKPLIALLKAKPDWFDGQWFRDVSGAADYASLNPDALPLPAAWIVRSSESAKSAGERAVRLKLSFDVVIAISNERIHAHMDADETLLQYRKAVEALLLGWEIEADVRPVQFEGGRVIEYAKRDIFWADKYSFEALITNYLPDPVAYGGLTNTGGSTL
ncbi:phage tail terminator protein [Candidatus Ferrigenium straubiae]|jgi:hypothetical protein|uniref:phage tail terminator protein n=1 Tax=Candidatus Ferrigenium straubiae TaxID=2919506 RepID=UPI003F4AEC79